MSCLNSIDIPFISKVNFAFQWRAFFSDIFGYAVLECIIKNHTELQIIRSNTHGRFSKTRVNFWICEYAEVSDARFSVK